MRAIPGDLKRLAPLTGAVGTLTVVCFCALPIEARTGKGAQAAPAPRVAVAIVVDQLAAWIADERLPRLPDGGGFARLRNEGTWTTIRYGHAMTETAPGHAALFTGKTPRENGIVANRVLRDGFKGPVTLLDDRSKQLIAADGNPLKDAAGKDRPGVSLDLLRSDTIADQLWKEKDREAIVIALSLKDRGAAYAAGRSYVAGQKLTVLWQDETTGRLVTSTGFAAPIPEWARKWDLPAPDGDTWNLDIQDGAEYEFVKTNATTDDYAPGEGWDFSGPRFPHSFKKDEPRKFRATPMADAFLVNLALEAVADACGPGGDPKGDGRCRLAHPMLLAISFSTNDYVGHRFGPDSWEAWDELFRLDQELARLFEGLDKKFGKGGYSVVLSGDHGIVPLPEVIGSHVPVWCAPNAPNPYQKPCEPGMRLSASCLRGDLKEAIRLWKPDLAARQPVRDVVDALVFMDRDVLAGLSDEEKAGLEKKVIDTLQSEAGVSKVFSLRELEGSCRPGAAQAGNELTDLVCASTTGSSPTDGDYYIVTKPGSFFTDAPYVDSHASPYRYDRTVPLLVRHAVGGKAGAVEPEKSFTSFKAALWYALTGDRPAGGGHVVGIEDSH